MPANSQTHDSNDTIELTAFKKFGDGVLSKVITKGPDGKPVSDGSACRMGSGRAYRRRIKRSFMAFAEFLGRCGPKFAIALGSMSDDKGDSVEIRSAKQLAQFYHPGAISRSLKFFCFRKGVPAFFLLDYDMKGMPEGVRAELDELAKTLSPEDQERYGKKAGFIAAIRSLIEGFDDLGFVLRDSTSAGVYDTETHEKFDGSGGAHMYLMLKDGADAPRAIRALADRAWLAGLGWYWVSKGGALLRRSIVDIVVASPERLIFEGKAVVIMPLAQHDRPCDYREGEMLDSVVALADIGKNLRTHLNALEDATKLALKPELEKVRKRVIEDRVEKAVARGEGPSRTRASIERMFSGEQVTLYPSVVLTFDNPALDEATVGEVLANPDKYVGETLADPIEPNGEGDHLLTNKALLFRGENGDLLIATCIHGGAIYRLRHDYDSIGDRLGGFDKKNKDDKRRVVKTLIEMLLMGGADSPVPEDEETLLIQEAKAKSGVGLPQIREMLDKARAARRKAWQDQCDAEAATVGATDDVPDGGVSVGKRSVIIYEPGNRAPLIAEIESEVKATNPDVYQRAGCIVVPEFVMVSNDGTTLPPILRILDSFSMGAVIESAVQLVIETEEGIKPISCPELITKTMLNAPKKSYRVINAIVNTPLVFPDGTAIDQAGYDHKSGILFDPLGVKFPPIPREPTIDDAMRALATLWKPFSLYRFEDSSICKPEVSKAVVISALLSAILRPTLPTTPGHGFSAPTYAAGKSKMAEAISVAATGVIVAPISQNQNPEEFEKSLISVMMEAQTIISIDNIDKVIESVKLAQAVTGDSLKVRLLGGNDLRTIRNIFLVLVNGKNLRFAKDLVRRFLMALVATDENPQTKVYPFDPVDLMRANRPEIVSAALTLVRAFQCAPDRKTLPWLNSFEVWSDTIRSSLHWATGADCVESQAVVQGDDPELNDLQDFMDHWLDTLGTQGATVSELVDAVNGQLVGKGGPTDIPEDARVAFRSYLVPRFGGHRGEINNHRVGNYLSQSKNRYAGGRRLVNLGGAHNNVKKWTVEVKGVGIGLTAAQVRYACGEAPSTESPSTNDAYSETPF